MPEGTEIGDGYIEVRLDVDERNIKAAEKRLQKSIDKNLKANVTAQQTFSKFKQKSDSADFDHSIKLLQAKEKMESEALDHSIRLIVAKEKAQGKLRKAEFEAYRERDTIYRRDRKAQEDLGAAITKRIDAVNRAERAAYAEQRKRNSDSARRRGGIPTPPRRGSNNRGKGLGGGITDGIQNVLSILPGQLEKLFKSPAIVGIAAAAGVEFAGIFGAAMSGAVSGGLLGGGIALAIAADPELQAAGKALGTRLFEGLKESAHDTLAPAIRESLKTLTDTNFADNISGKFKEIFFNLKDSIGPLTSSATQGINDVVDGFNALSLTSGPVLEGVGDLITKVSGGIKSMFEELAAHPEGFKILLNDLGTLVSGAIKSIGKIAGFAADARIQIGLLFGAEDTRSQLEKAGGLNGLNTTVEKLQGNLARLSASRNAAAASGKSTRAVDEQITAQTGRLNDALALQTSVYNTSRAAALGAAAADDEVTLATQAASDAIKEHLRLVQADSDATYAAQDAAIAYARGQDDLKDAFKGSNDTISLGTKIGQDHRKVLIDQFKAARDQAQAIMESGGTAEEANAKFKALTDKTIAQTGAVGKQKAEMIKLRGEYKAFKDAPGIEKRISILLNGFNGVKAQLDQLTAPQRKVITVMAQEKGKSVSEILAGVNKQGDATSEHAAGGAIRGPGSGTSDSIPAMLSNGEYVIKASSAKSIGIDRLNQMNRQGFASGGSVGRGKTAGQVAEYNRLIVEIAGLKKSISTQTKALSKYTEQLSSITQTLDQNTNLSSADASGSGGQFLKSLQGKRQQNQDFVKNVQSLKKRGLGQQGLEQLVAAGPDSPLGKLLSGSLSNSDLAQINKLLVGDAAEGKTLANLLNPGAAGSGPQIASNSALLKKKQARAAALKAPLAKGASIRYVNGKPQAFFSSKELADQNLRKDTYVTVMIDGKEVRAIVKQEITKSGKKTTSKLQSGRR